MSGELWAAKRAEMDAYNARAGVGDPIQTVPGHRPIVPPWAGTVGLGCSCGWQHPPNESGPLLAQHMDACRAFPSVIVGEHGDYIECRCGNDPTRSGFYASTGTGLDQHDEGGSPYDWWDGEHVKCAECGAVYSLAQVEEAGPGGMVLASSAPDEAMTDRNVQIHMAETRGFGSSWSVVCNCGWRRAAGGVGYATQAEARSAGDAHLRTTNGRVRSDA